MDYSNRFPPQKSGLPLAVLSLNQLAMTKYLHFHDYCELVIVRKGTGIHLLGGELYPIRQGDILLIPPRVVHTYLKTRSLFITNVMFYGEALGISSNKFSNVTALKTLFPMFYSETETRRDSISKIKIPRKDYKTLEEIAQSLDRCFNKSVCTQPLIAVSAFYQLLDLICQHLTIEQNNDLRKPVRHKVHHEEIANVITYIHQNFGKKITLDNMVQHASSSRSRLGESFKRVTGMSPMHYLNIYRLEKASELLKMGSHPIRTIANKVGLFDNAHLTRLFKSVFGVSPMQFRMSHKQSLGAS